MSQNQPRQIIEPLGSGAYPNDLEPVARPSDFVQLSPMGEVRRVEAFAAQPGIDAFDSDGGNGITVSANSTNYDNEAKELRQPDGWLAQYRLIAPGRDIPDGINVQVDHGGEQAPLYTTKNGRGEFDQETGTEIGHEGGSAVTSDEIATSLLEWYVVGDTPPIFTFENTTGSDVTVSDIRFSGFQYRLSTATGAPSGVRPIVLPVRSQRRD